MGFHDTLMPTMFHMPSASKQRNSRIMIPSNCDACAFRCQTLLQNSHLLLQQKRA